MMNLVSFISVRSASSRLPNKCFLKFGDETVLEHVIKRALRSDLNPIVCTTTHKEDERILEICKSISVPFFRGPSINKVLRWDLCCREFGIKQFHTIDADDPFFCPNEVKRSFETCTRNNYDMVKPYKSSADGSGMVGFSLKASLVNKALIDIDENTDTEMAWSFFQSNNENSFFELEPPKKFEIFGRLTLDYWEDYIFLNALRLILGDDSSRENIYNILEKNKDLKKINSFRSQEWKNNQIEKIKKFTME